ncbi:PREDICTED: kinesin-like protein KIF20A isoform X2 [Ceratosolen solmsi marchali]|uniref:Kinesin-like protein KIF20A isoform X2 n=1 Tax=Ceratosolen solmsi marchali TaxID=326594 RepID=A0AAJ6VJJ9_9HYME|nr:PREDICTED: kinesin-like protein KIF20A isoform X2 [Ceratosolen solmsi marchali]
MGDTSYNFYNINHKMNPINSTQSSENESIGGDMSYLYGRDPSILAYGQRPFPSQESKRNLISSLEEEKEDESIENRDKNLRSINASIIQTIKVFLRMKPYPAKMKITPELSNVYTILNSTTLLTKMPSLDNNTSCLKKIKMNDTVSRKFIFTQTFGPKTSQLQLFEEAVKPQMIKFLSGQNSIVMSYGTTNSGKTYTLQGTVESPGIIPRGIEFVFSNINPREVPYYKPVNLCDVVFLNNHERLHEMDLKMKLLTFNSEDKNYHVRIYKQMQRLLQEESPIRPSQNYNGYYSVWISFAEIYNETIYDLLWNDCQRKQPPLKLVTDCRGRAYIKGLKSINVNSGAEAYQVLMAGQYNLKIAATALNSRSSRSHCIFTIKLLKYRYEHDPNSVEVSMFTFCDLAGSERLKKTLNVGERLKEAQNINTSLLVLGRCLKTIYESQCSTKQKNESIGPFRESKLTRLFQRALLGKEQLALIVNVNPVPNLYVETQNVLNFSAIAKKIVIENAEIVKRRHSHSRFSRLVTQNLKTDMDWENTELVDMTEASEEVFEEESEISENDLINENLLIENELLKKEIKDLKDSILKKDMQTRKEMTDMYIEILKKSEESWKNRMLDMEEQQEDLRELAVDRIELFYKEKLNQLNSRKRSRLSDDEEDDSNIKKELENLEIENTCLATKIETMKKSIRDLKQLKDAEETEKTKLSFELAVAKEETKRTNEMLLAAQRSINSGENISDNYVQELTEICKKKDDRIKTMKIFLNEAKEEYIFITEQAQKLENQIKTQNELLVENKEHINDLEEQLTQANIYSSEQSKFIEDLEEQLDQQMKNMAVTEEKVKNLSEKCLLVNNNKCIEINTIKEDNQNIEKTKPLLEEIKLRLELSQHENNQLKEKLNQRVNEIELLKSKLDTTKNQLDKVTERVNNLIIEDVEKDILNNQNLITTVEQEIQTEAMNSLNLDLTKVKSKLVNISCQTEIHMEQLDEIKEQYEETKEVLKDCRLKKEEIKKQLDTIIIDKQNELDKVFEKFEKERSHFKDLIETQNIKDKNLTSQITDAIAREHDKDNEISSLQKEMKNLIQTNEEAIIKMEIEVKNILKDLTISKEQLTKTEERNKKIEKDYRQIIQILELKIDSLEDRLLQKRLENEQHKLTIEELKKSVDDTEHELEVFTKNRNETVAKYEDLVKSQYDELDFHRKEVTRLQDLFQELKENHVTPLKGNTKKSRCNIKEEKKKDKSINTRSYK